MNLFLPTHALTSILWQRTSWSEFKSGIWTVPPCCVPQSPAQYLRCHGARLFLPFSVVPSYQNSQLKAIALTTLPAIRLRKPIKGGQGSLRTTHRAAAISETAQHLPCTPTTAHNPQASTNIVLPEKAQCRDCEAQQEAGGIEEHTVSPLPTARGPHASKVWILAVLPSSAVVAALLARSASRKSCPNASWMHRTARARRFPRSKDIRHA